jgi:hypothetical protein
MSWIRRVKPMNRLRWLWARAAHPVVRGAAVLVLGLWATTKYASVVEPAYPLDDWLFWTLLALFGWVGVFNLACFCFGQLILRRVLMLGELPPLEACVQGMMTGVVGFVMFMYAGGALALYGPVFAVLLPAVMIAAGASDGIAAVRRLWAEIVLPRRGGPLVAAVAAFGVLCTGLIYLGVMTPDAINYDAAWYHAVIPQEYARQGKLIPLPGNYSMAVPHLHGMVHTWGFCVPGLDMPRRWMLLLHNEFGLFVWTLIGVLAGVRRLIDDQRVRGAWTAMYLFPSIAVYDYNMGGAGDHIAAFFALPMLLAMFELCRTFSTGSAALFAAAAAGCSLTKYQAIYLVVPMAAVLFAAWVWRLWALFRGRSELPALERRARLRPLIRAPLVVVGLGVLLVSPHFIKNVVFYGNPLYPFAQDLFASSWPVVPNGQFLIRYIFTDDNWKPHGTMLQKARHALELAWNFSWTPHYSFNKNWPVFGSLFTLMLPFVVAVRRPQRIGVAALIGVGALFIWGYTYNVDRNLQLILPLLAAVTGALIVASWRLGWIARFGLVPLVAFQLVWGADAYFYSAHDRISSAMALINSGHDGAAARRFDGYRATLRAVGEALPRNARVLLHATHGSLGVDREIIQDWAAFQGMISYDPLRTPRELYDHLVSCGITHIVYVPRERPAPTKQEDVLFYTFVKRYAVPFATVGGYRLLRMPDAPPPVEKPYQVGVWGLSQYSDGIYPIERLNTNQHLPGHVQKYAPPERQFTNTPAELADLDALIIAKGARPPALIASALDKTFATVVDFPGHFTVYVRKER